MSSYSNKNSRFQRSKKDLNEHSGAFENQKNWIGIETVPAYSSEKPEPKQNSNSKESRFDYRNFQARPVRPYQSNIPQHSYSAKPNSAQLMQDILKVAEDSHQRRLYYSKEAEENLSQLLTNRFKLNSYLKRLDSDMCGLNASTVKNYEVLTILLQQLSNADVQVKQGEEGMELQFDRGVTQRQEGEIERLQREREEKEKQMKYVVEEYEAIIFNFNDVIEKLVAKEEFRNRGTKY